MYTLGVLNYNSVVYLSHLIIILQHQLKTQYYMKQLIYAVTLFVSFNLFSQSETSLIRETLKNYINGTSYNNIPQINKAFHDSSNLYLDNKDKGLRIVPIATYTSYFKNGTPGTFNGRIGKIISVDQFENIAFAKAEILMPKRKMQFIDMFLLKKLDGQWKIISKSATSTQSNKQGDRILFVVSNAHFYKGTKLRTGNSFAEIVNAYDTFSKAGYTVDFVSPEGGALPLAYINTSSTLEKEYLYNPDFMAALENTFKPEYLEAKNYKAVHYIGGGSAMFNVPFNKAIQTLVMQVYEEHNGIISSVCHGTAGIVNLKTKDGNYLVNGKTINGYPEAYERKESEQFKSFPLLIQKGIEDHGGTFKYAPRNTAHVEIDGRVITGQNYLSSKPVAEAIIKMLEKQ